MGVNAAVCVPVRDEAMLLPRFLDALAAQCGAHPFTLCLLFDGCTDASKAIVAARAPTLPFALVTAETAPGPPNAGLARRRAMALGLEVLGNAGGSTIISTDADSAPDSNWLSANVAALAVADVAAGRIMREAGLPSPLQDRLEAYLDALFAVRRRIDPVPWEAASTHHCASATSLAFRAGAYRSLGGFAPQPCSEDAHMIDMAHRQGLRVRRDDTIRVTTSARRVGRAVGGMADHLRHIDAGVVEPMMAHPDDVTWRFERQAAARSAWSNLDDERLGLARMLGTDVAHVDAIAADALNAEAFATRVVPDVPGGERLVTLAEAEVALVPHRGDKRMLAA